MFWDKISNDRHFLKFDLSESCKSLDNSQLYRFCYISILHNLFYHIDGFQSEKSQNPYGAFFLGHPVVCSDQLHYGTNKLFSRHCPLVQKNQA